MITSLQNEKVKFVRSIRTRSRARRASNTFLCEGVRLVEEGLRVAWPARFILYSADLSERGRTVIDRYKDLGVPVEEVTDKIMQEIGDTEHTQGVLAVMTYKPIPLPQDRSLVVIPSQVRDPGNLGTILRSAAAAGVDAVLIPPDTVDAFSPKVMRAGMGAQFRLPIHIAAWEDIRTYLEMPPRLRVFLAAAGQGRPYPDVDLSVPLALIIGGEAFGADDTAMSLVDEMINIPMPGKMESLNAAGAAAVLIFEVLRQRRANA